jgi:hypothetical protein
MEYQKRELHKDRGMSIRRGDRRIAAWAFAKRSNNRVDILDKKTYTT